VIHSAIHLVNHSSADLLVFHRPTGARHFNALALSLSRDALPALPTAAMGPAALPPRRLLLPAARLLHPDNKLINHQPK
jgi:hypothetical protein